MKIKHLVFPGGGGVLFNILGSLQYLEKNNIWKVENIESIYGTSSGGILGVVVCLKYDWQTINDYFLERPWHEVYKLNMQSIINCYSKGGLFGFDFIVLLIKPLFEAKNISLDITMKEYYEMTKIDLHLFSFEVNSFKMIDLSHSSHPDLPLLKALYMSCTVPILLEPIITETECFIDGGIVSNYPFKYCIEKYNNTDEILGFNILYEKNDTSYNINESSSLIDIILSVLFKIIFSLNVVDDKSIKYEVHLKKKDSFSLNKIKDVILSNKIRLELFEEGVENTKPFLELHKKKS
jgi:predicted acylesterase/phospholipase RssA